ncbi:hypothetical protein [Natronobiforma cellulositropha]|uniref:hypothetical protein n=1 Tax=Natronobiforma cellulositropha TaxID=1679076 RepID=UPI0021D57184|nr:hypothetical protein [Natronobiforma cellulositropha]
MNTIISPDLLQLVALGTDGAAKRYLEPGRYLRWFPNSTLGFPRRGFVLSRRRSPEWPWVKRGDMSGVHLEAAEEIDGEGALWLPAQDFSDDAATADRGLRLSSPNRALDAAAGEVEIGGSGLLLEFRRDGQTRPDPAAWVAIRLAGADDVRVNASAVASSVTEETVEFSAVDARLGELDLWDPTGRLGGGSDRLVLLHGSLVDAVELHADGDAVVREVQWLIADQYATDASAPQQGDEATVWQEVSRFILPIDVTGSDYQPHPPGTDVDDLAATRLHRGATISLPPWDQPWPPSPVGPDTVADTTIRRYLDGPETNPGSRARLREIQRLLTTLLEAELDVEQPQGTFSLEDLDSSGAADGEGFENISALDLLLAASLDSPVAHLLGLATVDEEPPADVRYDYMVTAVYPSAWMLHVSGLVQPRRGGRSGGRSDGPRHRLLEAAELERTREDDRPAGLIHRLLAESEPYTDAFEAWASTPTPIVPPTTYIGPPPEDTFFRVASLATAVTEGSASEPARPSDLSVETVSAPESPGVSAEAHLEWTVPERRAFETAPIVGSTVTRMTEEGSVSLARTDPEYGLAVPHLTGSGTNTFRDASLERYGEHAWMVQTVDIWGRWSEPARTGKLVENEVPPMAPQGVTVTASGDVRADDEILSFALVEFGWDDAFAPPGIGIDRFELEIEPGYHDLEPGETLSSPSLSVSVGASSLLVDGEAIVDPGSATLGGDVDHLEVIETAGDGDEYEIGLTVAGVPIDRNAADEYRWEFTATVTAVDENGLSSPVGVTQEITYESVPPSEPGPQPGGVAETTWPDADEQCWWTCRWDADEGERVQVLTATESRLLDILTDDAVDDLADDEDGVDERADVRNLEDEARADILRNVASGTYETSVEPTTAFSPDHPKTYGHDEEHAVAIDAGSHDFTVVVPITTGPTGERAAWPTQPEQFAVVKTRRLERIPEPRVRLRALADDETDGEPVDHSRVELEVETSPTATRALVWRTDDADAADDLRTMQPRLPASLADGELEEGYVDAVAEDTWYAYRVAVEAPSGRRSRATEPIWVKSK